MTSWVVDVETVGLESIKDRILCITIMNVETDKPVSFFGEDEAEILTQYWNVIKENDEVVSFNGDSFDIPFIITRSIINKVRVKKNIKSCDLRKITSGFWYSYEKRKRGTLSDWAEIFGIEVNTANGVKMLGFYMEKNWEEIKQHCEEDVIITRLLWHRCKEVGLI